MPITRTYRFHEIFKEEVQAINQRRRQLHRGEVALELESRANPNSESDPAPASSGSHSPQEQADIRSDGEPIMRPTLRSGLAGLALSGGGIRSASFCLGALQALDKAGVLKKIDYLSTVSGGGYIATARDEPFEGCLSVHQQPDPGRAVPCTAHP
jgi:predicted acylesterase/phospholipase RssA